MEFIPAKCPDCGGELMLPKSKDEAICTYCGSKFFIKDAMNKTPTPSIKSWMILAKTAEETRNYAESCKYYTKVIEVDPENVEAWLGKAESVGWQSTIADYRLGEMVLGFGHVMGLVTEPEEKVKIAKIISEKITKVAYAYFGLTYGYVNKYIDEQGVPNNFHVTSINLANLFDFAFELDPTNFDAISSKVEMCKSILFGGQSISRLLSKFSNSGARLEWQNKLNESSKLLNKADSQRT